MTRDEAKTAIAKYCGTTIDKLCQDKNYCNLAGFIFSLSLIGSSGSANKKTRFYYYSIASLKKENEVMGLWLQDKLCNKGFSKEEFQVRTNRSTDVEGHVADFYLDIDWENLSDKQLGQIKKLYERLKAFQEDGMAWPNDVNERNRQIAIYNQGHLSDVKRYIAHRRKEMSIPKEEQNSLLRNNSNMKHMMTTIQSLLESNLNVILTGAPGTGKTYTAKEVAKAMVGAIVPEDATEEEKRAAEKAEEERIQSVQFHPGYDYSDFVIGMKPVLLSNDGKELEMKNGRYVIAGTDTEVVVDGESKVSFRWKDGIFKKFAKSAKKAYDEAPDRVKAPKYVFLIDEINRADLSRVFGELFSLLEEEYRYPNNPKGITLPNGENFVIPENLFIIGTMNDIDRSVESMDFALRRRFAWYEVTADQSEGIIGKKVSDKTAADNLVKAMKKLNAVIGGEEKLTLENETETDLRLGTAYQLGGAIFAKFEKCSGDFAALWNNHISNVLGEYLRGRRDRDDVLKTLMGIFNKAIGIEGGGKNPEAASQA